MNRRQRRRRARFRLLAGLTPIITLAGLWGAGLGLPVLYRREEHRVLPNSREALWSLLTDLDGMPSWRQDLIRLERLPAASGQMRWLEVTRGGAVAMEQVEAVRFERLVVRVAPNETISGQRRWTYALKSAANGTELAMIEEREIRNPLVRSLVRVVGGDGSGIGQFLRALERRLAAHRQVALQSMP